MLSWSRTIYHAAQKNMDYAQLVAIDLDFVFAIGRVEDFGCRSAVLAFGQEAPDGLKKSCDDYRFIGKDGLVRDTSIVKARPSKRFNGTVGSLFYSNDRFRPLRGLGATTASRQSASTTQLRQHPVGYRASDNFHLTGCRLVCRPGAGSSPSRCHQSQ